MGATYNVIGFVTGALGLGVAARNTIRELLEADRDVRVVDLDPGEGRHRADLTYAKLPAPSAGGGPVVNLFHMNPLEIVELERAWRPAVRLEGALCACVPFWELPLLPEAWLPVLDAMDVVLAPSRFIEEACRVGLTRAQVVHLPQTIRIPEGVERDRERWGFAADELVVTTAFDASSDLDRKNPEGALAAFASAFGESREARFVLKAGGARRDARVRELADRVRAMPNGTVIEDELGYRDVLSLYASSDVVVSLHRSEGLGLPLMEAMSLGVATVATGWSGNMDFMDVDDSSLVRYELVPLRASHPRYVPEIGRPGQVWAEPDTGHAAGLLRGLAVDADGRRDLGGRAAAAMAARVTARPYLAALERLEDAATAAGSSGKAGSALARELARSAPSRRRAALVESAKRGTVRTLRRLRLYPPAE